MTIRKYKTHSYVLDLRAIGQGRKFFPSREAARKEKDRVETHRGKNSEALLRLSAAQVDQLVLSMEAIAEYGETVASAVLFRIAHLKHTAIHGNKTVGQVADEAVAAKLRDGMSQHYVHSLKSRLDRFCRDFGNKLIGEITTATLDNYVRAIPLSPKTRLNHRINIGAMFSYAESRGMIKESPMRRAARPKVVQQTPGILTPSETRALSEAAHREQPDMLPALAIGAFAGLRTEEIKRLERPSLRAQRN